MKNRAVLLITCTLVLSCWRSLLALRSDAQELKTGAFQVQQELILPASPEAVYDAMTGDISGWWDHSFLPASEETLHRSRNPAAASRKLSTMRAMASLHATVIYADRGKTHALHRTRSVSPARPITIVTIV